MSTDPELKMEDLKMSEVKVSVVMPVYNSMKYLDATLNDVVNQSLKDIEIICVDDGSTDGSAELLDEYAKKDARITVIHQHNQYAGVARNNGLAVAKGKYVIFWDADDNFESETLMKMYEAAEKSEAEIVVCDADEYMEDTETYSYPLYIKYHELPEARPFSRKDIGDKIFDFSGNVPWNKMYLKSFVKEHELQFEATRQFNDMYFVMLAYYYANRIITVDEVLIHYRVFADGGLTKTASTDPLSVYHSYQALQKVMQDELEKDEDLKRAFQNKVLAGFMRIINLQTTYEGYDTVLSCIRNGALQEFGIDTMKKEDYFAEWMYEHVDAIQRMSTNDFLVWKLRVRYLENKNNKDKIIGLKVRRDQLKEERAALRVRRDELKARREELKEELREKNQIIKEQKAILESRPVRFALKTKQILTLNGRLHQKK